MLNFMAYLLRIPVFDVPYCIVQEDAYWWMIAMGLGAADCSSQTPEVDAVNILK